MIRNFQLIVMELPFYRISLDFKLFHYFLQTIRTEVRIIDLDLLMPHFGHFIVKNFKAVVDYLIWVLVLPPL